VPAAPPLEPKVAFRAAVSRNRSRLGALPLLLLPLRLPRTPPPRPPPSLPLIPSLPMSQPPPLPLLLPPVAAPWRLRLGSVFRL
jgi:hypothetical protein